MRFRVLLFLLISSGVSLFAQVKIGDNSSLIHANSILELESADKVLVISRMTNSQMNSIQPLHGALVFNTDQNCVFMFDGSSWRSLCNISNPGISVTTATTAPTSNTIGDIWINNAQNNLTSIWDGNNWISLDNNPRSGNGAPTASTPANPIAGELYVDATTGSIYAFNGSAWVNSNTTTTANNGLLISADNSIQLGGVLIQPTTIQTNAANTLAITGLQDGDVTQDQIVTVNNSTGQLRKVSTSQFFREEVTEIEATDGQLQFTPLLPIDDSKKVNLYRNGVRVDFTVINNSTIEIEPEAICYSGDKIRIVQFY